MPSNVKSTALLAGLATRLRTHIGQSQAGLAALNGPSAATQVTLETGKTLPSSDTVLKLQAAYQEADAERGPVAAELLAAAYAAVLAPPAERPIILSGSSIEVPDCWDQTATRHHSSVYRTIDPLAIAAEPLPFSPRSAAEIADGILTPVLATADLVLWRDYSRAYSHLIDAVTRGPEQDVLAGNQSRRRVASFGAAEILSQPAVVVDPTWQVVTLDLARQVITAMESAAEEVKHRPQPSAWAPVVLLACAMLAYAGNQDRPLMTLGTTQPGPLQFLEAAHQGGALTKQLQALTSDPQVFLAPPRQDEIEAAVRYLQWLFQPFQNARIAALDADITGGVLGYRGNAIRSVAQLVDEPTVVLCSGDTSTSYSAVSVLGAAIQTAVAVAGERDLGRAVITTAGAETITALAGMNVLTDPTADSYIARIVYADFDGLIIIRYRGQYLAERFTTLR